MIGSFRANRALDRIGAAVPWPRLGRDRRCFINLRPTFGGPGYFVRKLGDEFQRSGVAVTYRQLRSARAALLFSVAWGDWFHALCRKWGVRTVLRLDGIYLPTYFDNKPQPSGHQDRRLTPALMATNARVQRDLLMSDFVIYQSAFSKRMADEFLFNRRDAYDVIHNGINLDIFRPADSRHRGRLGLLSCGSIRDEYMLGTILPVFGRLWREADLELLIVGPLDAANHALLAEFIHSHPEAAQRVEWVGPIPNERLSDYLRRADILIHPRLGDWCPNAVVEAIACGVPVVCGSWGGTAELVGDAGVIVETEPWNYGASFIDGIVTGVRQILNDIDFYRDAARARAEAQFDIRSVARRYLSRLEISES